MEETLGGSNTGLSPDTNIDGEIDLPCHSGTFNIDYADCVDFLLLSHFINNHDQIFGLS